MSATGEPRMPKRSPSAGQREIAEQLVALSNGTLKSPSQRKDGVLVLDFQTGSSIRNKNVVTVCPNYVRFTVSDASFRVRASELGVKAESEEDSRKLKFLGLTTAVISLNTEFFTKLVAEAKRESIARQATRQAN